MGTSLLGSLSRRPNGKGCGDFWANPEICEKAAEKYVSCGTNLENTGVEFDIIDDYAIMGSVCEEDGIRIGKGAIVGSADSENIELVAKRVKGEE